MLLSVIMVILPSMSLFMRSCRFLMDVKPSSSRSSMHTCICQIFAFFCTYSHSTNFEIQNYNPLTFSVLMYYQFPFISILLNVTHHSRLPAPQMLLFHHNFSSHIFSPCYLARDANPQANAGKYHYQAWMIFDATNVDCSI